MYKIALTSTGPLSGKTTLAEHLRDQYGFLIANHSLTLVTDFVREWNEKHATPITVEKVYANKEDYRQGLQQHGQDIGFSSETATYKSVVRWTKKTLAEWLSIKPQCDVVFDSIRDETQAQVLRDMGFTIVQLNINEPERRRRAEEMGVDIFKVWAAMDARPDLERGISDPDITLDSSQPLDVQAKVILSVPPRAREEVNIFGQRIIIR